MQKIKDVLKNRFQGLPGLGINGRKGDKGEKGTSIYIGHLRSFFDYTSVVLPNYVYIREKNTYRSDLKSKNLYYRDDSNFYGGRPNDARIGTFSIYNLRGLYFDKPSYETTEHVTYKTLIKSDDFGKRKLLDAEGNPVVLEGWEYYNPDGTTTKGYTEEQMARWKKTFIDVDDVFFAVNIDEEYIKERRENEGETNYNQNATDDVIVPTNLKSIFNVGDILYLLDDVTDEIINYIVVTADILGCTFDKFLEQKFISCDSIKSTFKVNDERVSINKSFFVTSLDLRSKDEESNNRFRKNFVRRVLNDYPLFVAYNNDASTNREFISLETRDGNFTVSQNPNEDSFTQKDNNFVFKAKNMKFDNLFIKNIDTNINIKEYDNSDLIYVNNFLYIAPLTQQGFKVSETDNVVEFIIDSASFYNQYVAEERNYVYGMEIYKKNPTNNSFTLLKRLEAAQETEQIEFRLKEEWFTEGTNTYGVVLYVSGEGVPTSYSKISELEIECEIADAKIRITNYTFRQGSTAMGTSDDFENDYCFFNLSELTCDKIEDAILSIATKDEMTIRDVYIGNEKIVDNGVVKEGGYHGAWLSVSKEDFVFDSSTSLTLRNINIDENLQDIEIYENGVKQYYRPQCVGECLYLMSKSGYRIGEKIQETLDRSIVVTVFTTDATNTVKRSSFVVTQPGFSNPLNDVSVSFTNIYKNNKLENANQADKGVLCNQFQTFTDINVHSFNYETWGKYFDEPRIRINVMLDTQTVNFVGNQTYCEESNYNNVHFYSKYDKDRFPNNAVKTNFYWMKGNQGVSIDSNVADLNNSEISHELKTDIYLKNTPITTQNGWVAVEDVIFNRKSEASTIPYDYNFKILESEDGTNSVGGEHGLTFAEVNNDNKVKLRIVSEIANPVPMEFNFRWAVDSIEILGQLKEEYKETWKQLDPTSEHVDEDILFGKLMTETITSDNMKFIINPISMVLCPSDVEAVSPIKGAVKIVGSDEMIKIKTSLQDIDARSKTEFYDKGYNDIYTRYAASKIISKNNMDVLYVSDITHYLPKKKYLQDNVSTLSIKPKKLKEAIQNGVIRIDDSSFLQMNENFLRDGQSVQSRLNIYPIDWSTNTNSDHTEDYIQLRYNADYFNPTYRKGVKNFYYNDELYPCSLYNQWNDNSPIWVKQDVDITLVDSKLIEAHQIWNYEYEVSEMYKEYDVFGGILTKSGNGYISLISDYDEGQYENDDVLSLEETKKQSDEYVLTDDKIDNLTYPNDYVNRPEKNGMFRTLLFNADWSYPNFVSVDADIKVYPYTICNSFESYLDTLVMDGITLQNQKYLKEFIDEKCKDSEHVIFVDGTDVSVYYEKKIEQGIWITSEGAQPVWNPNVNVVKSLIPYNLLFDVYPRTMYNTDAVGNVMNIFMLQQPSVGEDGHYKFDETDRCFTIKENGDHETLFPWDFNK